MTKRTTVAADNFCLQTEIPKDFAGMLFRETLTLRWVPVNPFAEVTKDSTIYPVSNFRRPNLSVDRSLISQTKTARKERLVGRRGFNIAR